MKKKELMFAISGPLSHSEAVCFTRTLKQDEDHYLVEVSDNPNARTSAKKERYVVVRYPRKGENVIGAYAFWCGKEELGKVRLVTRFFGYSVNLTCTDYEQELNLPPIIIVSLSLFYHQRLYSVSIIWRF